MKKNTQEKIIEDYGSVIIKAGAGRGKTTLLGKKINHDYKKNNDHRVFAAITFTNKAVEEIKNKVRGNDGIILTIDSFIMQEIVSPFIHHLYGDDYKKLHLERDFTLKDRDFITLLDKIKTTSKVGTYYTTQKDFISELALNILENSFVAQRYFKAKYYKLYIDEYQDLSKEQHNLFKYINDSLKINLFILGDPKQNIYSWRGASSDGFNSLYNYSLNFTKYELEENYRCHKNIQKFLEIFEKNDTGNLDFNYNNNVKFISTESELEKFLIENETKEICILTKTRDHAKQISESYAGFIYIPHDEISTYSSSYKWFTKEVLHFILSEKSNVFNLINTIPFEVSNEIAKKLKIELNKMMTEKNYSFEIIQKIFKIIFTEITTEDLKKEFKMIEKIIKDKSVHIIYNMHKAKNLVMTMHSSKGMEFEVVIVFAETLFKYTTLDDNLNYVSMSRGKEKLGIIYSDTDGQYINSVCSRLTTSQQINFKKNIMSVKTCLW